jgi:hypothetical protein
MTSNNPDAKIIKPAKPNLDVPKGVKVERVPSGAVNSRNEAGGEVDRSRYTK